MWVSALFLFSETWAPDETSVRSGRVRVIANEIWRSEYSAVADSCRRLISEDSSNPVGYFLLGVMYYSISAEYRTDRYVDSVTDNLDAAIKLAQRKLEETKQQADWYFVLGSALGCRALFRSLHGGWWGAFRDGHGSCSNLEKAYEMDTTLTDALAGIGAYHYWKSAKSKVLSWLPLVADRREQGIAEIRQAIRAGRTMSPNARKAMLAILYEEKRYEEALGVADSLTADGILDGNSQLHLIRTLIELKRWPDAERVVNDLTASWRSSTYADSCGACELRYLSARMLASIGQTVEAREKIRQIISAEPACHNNAYFRNTLAKARALSF